MRLTACYVVCNEEALIAESLRSVKAYVDRYVIVDAVFENNPHEGTHSSDRTREVCERVCAPVPLTYVESDRRLDEASARNRYLAEVPDGDWCLVIDGDEVMYGRHQNILAMIERVRAGVWPLAVEIPVYTQSVLAHGMAPDVDAETYATSPIICSAGRMARFFRQRPGLHYKRNELGIAHGLYDADERFAGRSETRCPEPFIVNHHVRQSHADYLNDYAWETADRRP